MALALAVLLALVPIANLLAFFEAHFFSRALAVRLDTWPTNLDLLRMARGTLLLILGFVNLNLFQID